MKTKIAVLCLTSLLVGIISVVFADVPRYISYQGKLTNSSGTPLDGTYSFTFALFDAVSGPAQIWTETQSSVHVSGGLYSVILGTTTTGVTGSFDVPYWLEITVNGETLVPRQMLTASPYSLSASGGGSYIVSPSTGISNGTLAPGVKFSTANANAAGTPDGTTYLRGDNTWAIPTGAGDMVRSVDGTAIGASTAALRIDMTAVKQSTGVLQLQFASVGVSTANLQNQFVAVGTSTGVLRTDLTAVKQSTGALQLQFAAVGVSTANLQNQFSGIGTATGTLRADLTGVQQSTGALQLQFAAVGVSTANLQNQFSGIGTATGTLRADLTGVQQSTGALQLQFAAVGVSTANLQNQFSGIGTATGTLRADLTAVQQSTGTLQSQFLEVAVSTTSLQSQFAAVGTSTGTLRADLTAVQQSTGTIVVGTVLPATAPAGFMYYNTDDFTFYIATETVASANSWRKLVTTSP